MGTAGTDTREGIGVLRGWKEIAQYLRTSERTATRWSIEKGLPVHRSGRGSLVLAYRSELDGWQRQMAGSAQSLDDVGELPRAVVDLRPASSSRKRRRGTVALFLLLGTLVAILGLVRSNELLGLKTAPAPLADDEESNGSRGYLVRLEPEGLEPASVTLTDGGTASVDFPGLPTLRLKVRKNGTGVIVTVAQQTTPDGVSKGGSETTLEIDEGTRVRLKKPFTLVLTWRRSDSSGRAPAER